MGFDGCFFGQLPCTPRVNCTKCFKLALNLLQPKGERAGVTRTGSRAPYTYAFCISRKCSGTYGSGEFAVSDRSRVAALSAGRAP